MNKITVTDLVDFGRKTPRGRQTLVNNLKTPKVKTPDEGGGNYWISALSCLAKAFVDNSQNIIDDKIDELIDKIENAKTKKAKDMHQANINILQDFEEYDFTAIKPNAKLVFIKKNKAKSIVDIKKLPLYAMPHHVFSFEKNEIQKIGAVWFVAKKGGFKIEELAMVTDLLYRYLDTNYTSKYEIDMDYCLAVDVNSLNHISYTPISTTEIKSPLMQTVNEMKVLM